jgi:hypothetical protein
MAGMERNEMDPEVAQALQQTLEHLMAVLEGLQTIQQAVDEERRAAEPSARIIPFPGPRQR